MIPEGLQAAKDALAKTRPQSRAPVQRDHDSRSRTSPRHDAPYYADAYEPANEPRQVSEIVRHPFGPLAPMLSYDEAYEQAPPDESEIAEPTP